MLPPLFPYRMKMCFCRSHLRHHLVSSDAPVAHDPCLLTTSAELASVPPENEHSPSSEVSRRLWPYNGTVPTERHNSWLSFSRKTESSTNGSSLLHMAASRWVHVTKRIYASNSFWHHWLALSDPNLRSPFSTLQLIYKLRTIKLKNGFRN